jgi:DNA-binding PucR family transcriptional regulator
MCCVETPWPTPSEKIKQLIRSGAEAVLNTRDEFADELRAAAFGNLGLGAFLDDPGLAENSRRINLFNLLHWASSNIQEPGGRASVPMHGENLLFARDLVRRGLDQTALDSYRVAQSIAWRRWTRICFDLTNDPRDLRELLDVMLQSISTYIDDLVVVFAEQIELARDELSRSTHAQRTETVSLLLEGAPIARARAESQLGYPLTGPQLAAIVWTRSGQDSGHLERAADILTRASDATRRLTVVASTSALWIWFPTRDIDVAKAARQLAENPAVHVALGRPGFDLDGFRRSHLQALTTQRFLNRLTSPHQVARYEDVQLAALMTADTQQADDFIRDTLGDFAHADAETIDTVFTWIALRCSSVKAAERLHSHRNTVIRRVAAAEQLLPRPLSDNFIAVAAALELQRWQGGAEKPAG